MERWACVDVPALPLQILVLRNQGWAHAPAAVIDVDKPQGRIVQVNAHARRASVRPGMRYAAALSIAPSLRAGVVDEVECGAAVTRLLQRLRAFSPEIEPSAIEPGVFWLDASGFNGLFPSLEVWGDRVLGSLRGAGLQASVAVGYGRFASYALARQGRGVQVVASREEERALSNRVSLDLLRIEPKLRAALDRLGIDDVGALRRLPDGGLGARFGEEGQALERFVVGNVSDMLMSVPDVEPIAARFEIEPGEQGLDARGLLFLLKGRIGQLCATLAERGQAVAGFELRLLFEKLPPRDEVVRPAESTLDEVQLTDLVRLRIENVELEAEVTGFELCAEGARATRQQLELFAERPRRDPVAANRALARLRAEFGDDAVVCAELREGHLPEAAFRWRPLSQLREPSPGSVSRGCLVRRVLTCPRELERNKREPDGWFAAGLASGPVRRTFGPYVVSGGWWRREIHREYHLAETSRGDVLWVFYDRRRRRWYLQGVVE